MTLFSVFWSISHRRQNIQSLSNTQSSKSYLSMLRTVSGRGSSLSDELKSQTLSHNSFVFRDLQQSVTNFLGKVHGFSSILYCHHHLWVFPFFSKILGSHHLKTILSLFCSQVFFCFLTSKSFIYLDVPLSSSCIRDFLAFYAMCRKNPYWFLFLYSVIPCNFKTFHFIFKLVSFSSSAVPCILVL